jgi:hypothetical protein
MSDSATPAPVAPVAPATEATRVESPPVAPAPPRDEMPDPRVRLLQLAAELVRSNNRRLVIEYLRLRRSM